MLLKIKSKMKSIAQIKNIIPDTLIIFGTISICYGVFLIYKPAGVICLGVMCIGSAILLIKGGDEN